MWKNKLFLKGLGIGLITAAILLQLMLTVKQADQDITSPNPAMVQKDAKLYTQEQFDEAVRKAVKAAKPSESPLEAPRKQVTVFIYEKMSAANVSDYLYRSGIIMDRDAFQNEISARGLEGRIRSNLYTFNLNENIEDVIKRITPSTE